MQSNRSSAIFRLPLHALVSIALLASCVALRIADPEPVSRLRLSVFDTYLRAAPRIADPSFPVRVVAIDEASLARAGQWPWPRTTLAELTSRLEAAGAKSIAFDLVLAEPDRLSPDALIRSLDARSVGKDIISEIAKLPSNDERLATAIASAPVVLGIAGNTSSDRRIAAYRGSIASAGDNPKMFVHRYPGGIESLPILTQAARGTGAVNWVPSEDQIVRRIPLLVAIGGNLYPSLALDALRVGTGQSTIFVKSSGSSGIDAFGRNTGIEYVRVGETILPSTDRGELWLKFAPADPRRTISASRILEGTFDPDDIKSRHVFIGATATGLLDLRATPLEAALPGVEIEAQALEQMLSGDHLVRPAYATGLEIAFIVGFGAFITWLIARSGALLAAAVGAFAIAGIVALSWFAYSHSGLLFDPVYPSLSIALLYLGTSLTSYVRSEFERAQIRSAFGHYVSPSVVAEIAKDPDSLKLGGDKREITLLFADVRGFSKLSEGLQPEGLVRFINRLFTPLADTILSHRGTIDKFIGDAVMAFWNAPLKDTEHARNACRTALSMLENVAQLNVTLADENRRGGTAYIPVRIGIGVNTGECVVGNVGSPQRFDYSVLGDVVNVAARFEEATKTFGVDIVVGERTAAQASGFALLELGTVMPRGKDRPERIFALVGDEALAASTQFRKLQEAHSRLLAAKSATPERNKALEDCRELCLPAIAGFYRNDAFRSDADRGIEGATAHSGKIG
jgi:adenylate cyclase